jgi:uncharacterized cupin superfamily protein
VPKIDIAKATVRTKGRYPDPWGAVTEGREKAALGDVVGLTQFGVNLTRLKPGAASALRHWHEAEDELVYVLEGEIVLIEDGGPTVLQKGEAAGFKAGVANGHHLVISRNGMRSTSKSARAPSVSARTIRISTWFTRRTKAAFGFHAGRGSLTRRAVARTILRSRRCFCIGRRAPNCPLL